MAPWDEPLPKTYRVLRTLLQREVKKVVDEVVNHMMNLIWELSQKSTKEKLDEAPLTEEQSPTDEEMLEEQICEESYQEDLDETLEDVIQPCKEALNSNNTGEFVE